MKEQKIFDRSILRKHKDRAAATINEKDFILSKFSSFLEERLCDMNRKFKNILQLGYYDESLAIKLREGRHVEFYVASDYSKKMLFNNGGSKVVADEELVPFASNSFDLILSSLNVHFVNDLPGSLLQLNKALKKDGVFLANIIGGASLHELKDVMAVVDYSKYGGVCARICPMIEVKTLGTLLQRAGFADVVTDSEVIQISYDDVFSLIHDLRFSAQTNILSSKSKFLSKNKFAEIDSLYKQKYSDGDDGIVASFDILTMVGTKC